MKRPRLALCMLMALLATSLYAVGFAADRDNLVNNPDAANWWADDSTWCEYAEPGYCEFAYRSGDSAGEYDGCLAADDDSTSFCNDDCNSAANFDDESEMVSYDEDDSLDLSELECVEIGRAALDEALSLEYASQLESESCDELAENAEPQEVDASAWSGRYCLAPEVESPLAESLPSGAIRDLVGRLSDSLITILDNGSEQFAGSQGQIGLPLEGRLGLLSGDDWSAANRALAASQNAEIAVAPLPLSERNLHLLLADPQPVTVRDLVRPLARLAVRLHERWESAWGQINEIAAESDPIPAVSSRPQPPQADEPADREPGRDTRTSLRPRRVEI